MSDEPHRANGAAIIAYYASKEPDSELAEVLEEVHREMNTPIDLSLHDDGEATPPESPD